MYKCLWSLMMIPTLLTAQGRPSQPPPPRDTVPLIGMTMQPHRNLPSQSFNTCRHREHRLISRHLTPQQQRAIRREQERHRIAMQKILTPRK